MTKSYELSKSLNLQEAKNFKRLPIIATDPAAGALMANYLGSVDFLNYSKA